MIGVRWTLLIPGLGTFVIHVHVLIRLTLPRVYIGRLIRIVCHGLYFFFLSAVVLKEHALPLLVRQCSADRRADVDSWWVPALLQRLAMIDTCSAASSDTTRAGRQQGEQRGRVS